LPIRNPQRFTAQPLPQENHREADTDTSPVNHHHRLLDAEHALSAERDEDDHNRARTLNDHAEQRASDESEHQ
jgi:hypothetical protein